MSDFEILATGNIAGDGTSGPFVVKRASNDLVLQLSAFGTASVQVQISLDGTLFVNEGTAISANGDAVSLPPCHSVQLVTTGHSAGTIQFRIGGLSTTGR